MISDEQEYPELNRKLKLVPEDVRVATDPAVCRYLDKLAEALQPIVNEAVAAIALDVLAYGTARKPIESYVGDAIEADRLRAELKARAALHEFLERATETNPSITANFVPDWRERLAKGDT